MDDEGKQKNQSSPSPKAFEFFSKLNLLHQYDAKFSHGSKLGNFGNADNLASALHNALNFLRHLAVVHYILSIADPI